MTASRFVELIAFILVPLSLLREAWWSPLLFGKPWQRHRPEGLEPLDLGVLNALTTGVASLISTLALTLTAALILSVLAPLLRAGFLPALQPIALGAAALAVALNPGHGIDGYWIMAGFILITLNLIGAFIVRE